MPVKTLKHRQDRPFTAGWDGLHLQNLSNWPARICETAILQNMANNKRVRMVFYALVTLEMLLLSALYAWGKVGLH